MGLHLHRYKYLWAKCTRRETIINAWKKLRKGKTKRRKVKQIENDFDAWVDRMQEMMINTYPGGNPAKMFEAPKHKVKYVFEHGKIREIYRPGIIEQWVHHIVVQVLGPIIDKFSYKYSCGSMPKRGGVYGKNYLRKQIKINHGFRYFAKLDIRHFFNHIRIDIVIEKLYTFIEDDWFMFLLKRIFMHFKVGMPLGFYPSQWLANFVLSQMDFMITRSRPIAYIRYVDDMVICDNSKKRLHEIIFKIKHELGKLRLKLKSNFQVIKFIYFSKGRPIDFMGFVFKRRNVILRKRIIRGIVRMTNRIHSHNFISLSQARSILSRFGWFKHTDCKRFFNEDIKPLISIRSLKKIVRKSDTSPLLTFAS